MTTYQDLFGCSNMDNATIDPSDITQQHQDTLASLFPGIHSMNPTMIDDWLADEFCKSGLNLLSSEKLTMLPHSPPISPSTVSESSSSGTSPKPPPCLFPDIAPVKNVKLLPRIAPRPMTAVMIKEPPTPIMPPTKRREPATPVDPDEITLKRQKNTDAARKSRLKKLVKMEQLEKRVSELESENHGLNIRVVVLESEKAGLESKDCSLQDRIRVLEAQLAEAHKALTKF